MTAENSRMAVSRKEVLKLLSITRVMDTEDLCRIYPGAEEKISAVINRLFRDRRLSKMKDRIALDMGTFSDPIPGMKKAFRVFAAFYPKIEYYTGEDYPGMFCFFAEGTEYEILYAAQGQEKIVNKVCEVPDDPPNRLVIIEDTEQIEKLSIPNAIAFCLVDDDGEISYFRKKEVFE